jgi:hypothetical protein
MFTMDDLQQYFDKATIEIKGMTFKLTKSEDMAGEVALWYSDKYKIRATPNFDNVPVPVEVSEIINGDSNVIDAEGYYGEVDNFEDYVNVVKHTAKQILDSHKTK